MRIGVTQWNRLTMKSIQVSRAEKLPGVAIA